MTAQRKQGNDATPDSGGRIVASMDESTVAEIMAGLESGLSSDPAGPVVALVLGEGAKLSVVAGQLRVVDGLGWVRRTRAWSRLGVMTTMTTEGADQEASPPPPGKLSRLVLVAGSGYVSLDAIKWCRNVGVALIVLDPEMTCHLAPSEGPVDGRILRLQVNPGDGLAVEVCRVILRPKLIGQAGIARSILGRAASADTIESLADALAGVATVDEARQLEAAAAACYFEAWIDNPATEVRFRRSDAARVPPHWLRFEGRRSDLTKGNSNRKASRPLNAILNFSYTVAGIEARLAAIALGLSPAIGFLHLDTPGRPGLVFDLVEPARPVVDRFVLGLVADRTFTRGDFIEQSDGTVRIAPWLRQRLAREMPAFARALAPHAEALVHLLGQTVAGKFVPATPLTSAKRKASASAVKARKARGAKVGPRSDATCIRCGAPAATPRAMHCPACMEKVPGQGSAVRETRGRAIAAARAAERSKSEWAPILAALEGIPLIAMMDATGGSKSAASGWRSGSHIPDRRHWGALASLAGVPLPPTP